jgi:16S rRNA processing protein RimM
VTLVIGTVLKPQGLKGEIKVMPHTDDVARFMLLKSVIIDGEQIKVSAVDVRGGLAYIMLEGIESREDAERLRGKLLSVDRKDAIKPPPGFYFIADLIGCEVFADGERLGVLKEIYQNGAADVYEVRGEKNLMFPALKTVLKSVDIEAKRIELYAERLAEVAVYED